MLMSCRLERYGQCRTLFYTAADALRVSAFQVQVQTGAFMRMQAARRPGGILDFAQQRRFGIAPMQHSSITELRLDHGCLHSSGYLSFDDQ
jgi:hypothetical protein